MFLNFLKTVLVTIPFNRYVITISVLAIVAVPIVVILIQSAEQIPPSKVYEVPPRRPSHTEEKQSSQFNREHVPGMADNDYTNASDDAVTVNLDKNE